MTPEIIDLARRLGAGRPASRPAVSLTQAGTMREGTASRFMRFTASQTIALRHPEFAWRASTGPFGCVTVVDALKDGEAELEVRLLGCRRLAGMYGGAAAAKGEIMRYLAELAWAPDAILFNPALSWQVVDRGTFRVACGSGQARGEVELKLDAHGRIASVSAPDRPRKEGARFVERPWHGRFADYREHLGRWLPFQGEAGWVLDGRYFAAWHGDITSWNFA